MVYSWIRTNKWIQKLGGHMKKKSFQLKTEKKQKRKNRLIASLFVILFMIGVAIFQADNILNYFVHQHQTTQFQKLSAEELAKNRKKQASFDYDAVEMINNKKIMDSLLSNEGANKNYVIAGISIPSVGIRLDIYKGVSEYALLRGAGTYFPDRELGKGNFVLAGHNMEDEVTLFSPLYRIQKAQKIYVSDGENIFVYKVSEILTISSTQVEVLDDIGNEQAMITLITCADSYAINRICVKGKLVEKIAVQDASSKIKEVFS